MNKLVEGRGFYVKKDVMRRTVVEAQGEGGGGVHFKSSTRFKTLRNASLCAVFQGYKFF